MAQKKTLPSFKLLWVGNMFVIYFLILMSIDALIRNGGRSSVVFLTGMLKKSELPEL